MKNSILLLAALLVPATAVQAEVLWAWDLSGSGAGSKLSTSEAVHLEDAVLSRGPALTENLFFGSSYQSIGWSTSDSPDLSAYLEITLASSPGYAFSLTSIELDHGGGTTAPVNFVLRSNLDGYTANLSSFTYLDPGNAETSSFNGLTVANQTSLTLRIYGFGAIANVNWGLIPIDGPELMIHGAVSAVPEPSSWGLLTAGTLAGLGLFRIRRRRMLRPV